jgi:hypothetical protein
MTDCPPGNLQRLLFQPNSSLMMLSSGEHAMRMMRKIPFNPARRGLLGSAAATIGVAAMAPALKLPAFAADAGLAPAADFTGRAQAFLALLSPEQAKAASFPWNGRVWRDWNYFGGGGLIKPGLRLEQMSAAQQSAAWDLLSAVFSEDGIRKTRNVMLLQDVLAAKGDTPSLRSSKRFSFAFFGTPGPQGIWGFRVEGHHLSQSITVRDNRIVSVTPSSFSSNPNRIGSGAHKGLVTLHTETQVARKLFGDLDARQAATARRSARPMTNILSWSGAERDNAKKTGIALAQLKSGQRELLWKLIGAYAQDYLNPALSAAQKGRLAKGDPEAIHFAWYGPNTPERAFGYRVTGDNFVIEFGSVDPDALHLHTIYHDLGNVLGRTA